MNAKNVIRQMRETNEREPWVQRALEHIHRRFIEDRTIPHGDASGLHPARMDAQAAEAEWQRVRGQFEHALMTDPDYRAKLMPAFV